jgi:ribonuclease HI
MGKPTSKFYVVWKGVKPGIYSSWDECKAQITAFQGAAYKGFPTFEEAKEAYDSAKNMIAGKGTNFKKEGIAGKKSGVGKAIVPSMSVDAACSGNPGVMEYRGVDTADKREIFRMGPFPLGTNNIGEFLALVHGLALMKKNGVNYPIYSDSLTARSWVRNRKIKTNLVRDEKTWELFALIDRALIWLNTNTYSNEILVWDTVNWGEIPADFGRK